MSQPIDQAAVGLAKILDPAADDCTQKVAQRVRARIEKNGYNISGLAPV